MTVFGLDTHPAAAAVLLELLRRASAARKLELVGQLNASVRLLAETGLRSRFPNDTPAQRRRRLADLMLGPELAATVYGPHTE